MKTRNVITVIVIEKKLTILKELPTSLRKYMLLQVKLIVKVADDFLHLQSRMIQEYYYYFVVVIEATVL